VLFIGLIILLSISSALFSSFSDGNIFFRAINPLNVLSVILIAVGIFLYVFIGQKLFDRYKISLKKIQNWALILTTAILTIVLLIYSQVPSVNDQGGLFVWPFAYAYWDQFDYMIPMGMFGGVLVKLFGMSGAFLAFRIMNLALMVLAFWLLGKITKKLFKNDKIAKIYWLIAPLCIQFIFYVSWAYGNIPSVCLMIFVIYLLMKFFEKEKWQYIAAIIPLSFLALAFKLQAQIVIIAVLIVLILRLFQVKNRLKTIILCGGFIFILVFTLPFFRFVANSMQNQYEITAFPTFINVAQGIAAYDENDKIAYQEMGALQGPISEMTGHWSYVIDGHTMTDLRNDELAKSRSAERIKYRLNEFMENPKMAARFFLRKQLSDWNSPDFGALQVWGASDYFKGKNKAIYQNDPNKPKLFTTLQPKHTAYNILYKFSDGYETLVYLMCAFGVVFIFRDRKHKKKLLILIIPLTFMGQFLLSLFTESGGRFNFYVFVLLLPFAAIGLWHISQFTDKKCAYILSQFKKKPKSRRNN
jgi:hypothetical protein